MGFRPEKKDIDYRRDKDKAKRVGDRKEGKKPNCRPNSLFFKVFSATNKYT